MWTARFIRKDYNSGLVFQLTNGDLITERSYQVTTIDSLKHLVQQDIDRFNNLDALEIQEGPFDTTINVDPDIQARVLYFQVKNQLASINAQFEQAVKLGTVKPEDPNFTAKISDLTTQLKETYRPEFEGL